MKLGNLGKDLRTRLMANPRATYVLLALVALILSAAATTKWY